MNENLETLRQAQHASGNSKAFSQYVLGALMMHVTPEQLDSAIDTARFCMTEYHS